MKAPLIGLLIGVTLLAGCGGGGDSEPALTKAEFLAQARAICKKGANARNQALISAYEERSKDGKALSGREREVIVTGSVIPELRATGEDLRELAPPESEQKRVRSMIALYDEAIAELESDPGEILKNTDNPFEKYSLIAKGYGLTECIIGV